MKRIEFSVKSSDKNKDPYRVVIEKSDSNLNAFCNCGAGINGQYCKHRFQVLSGNPENVIGAKNTELALVVDWLVGTDVEVALSSLALAEDQFEHSKKILNDAKKNLAVALRK